MLDDRFSAIMTDDRFKSLPGVGKIDKKGRRVTKGEEEGGEMDAFYKVAGDGGGDIDGDGGEGADYEGEEDGGAEESDEEPAKVRMGLIPS